MLTFCITDHSELLDSKQKGENLFNFIIYVTQRDVGFIVLMVTLRFNFYFRWYNFVSKICWLVYLFIETCFL